MSSTNLKNLIAIVLVAAVVVAGHLLPGLDNSRVENGIRNALHLLVFAVVAVALFQTLLRYGVTKASVVTIVVVALIGGLAEFAQYLAGRKPDITDVWRDLSGAALAVACMLSWHWARAAGRSAAGQWLLRGAAIVLGFGIFVPFLFWVSIVAMGRIAAPAVVDFSQWWHAYIYRPVNAEIFAPAAPNGMAAVTLLEWRRSGLIVSPLVSNWQRFEYLTITASMLTGPETNVTVRVNDGKRVNEWSDAFMEHLSVGTESQQIKIPLRDLMAENGHPAMDLTDIREIVIFARDRRKDTVLLLEEIRLE